ncbi:hypothetical protein CLH39_00345 [Alcaligenes faecalis]|nr:hypothetical protein CLH39_00345 [Alcaligenes faecalis]
MLEQARVLAWRNVEQANIGFKKRNKRINPLAIRQHLDREPNPEAQVFHVTKREPKMNRPLTCWTYFHAMRASLKQQLLTPKTGDKKPKSASATKKKT